MATETVLFYGNQIPCYQENNRIFVAIKPICDAIGLDSERQIKNISIDEILGPERSETAVQVGKSQARKMVFLPLEFVHGWLFQIKNRNTMAEETKASLLQYKKECYKVLFNHFNKNTAIQLKANGIEIKLLEEIAELNEQNKKTSSEIKAKRAKLEKVRKARLNNDPTLF